MIMIEYNEGSKAFLLSGKSFSYLLYVNGAGFLQNLHYGGKVNAEDAAGLISRLGKPVEPQACDLNMDMAFDTMPSEYGFTGRGDYREPTAVIERADGAVLSRFRYLSHEIYRGVPSVSGMPHVRRGGETLAIRLKDDFSDAEIVLNYTADDDSDVLVRNAVLKNVGKESVKLKKAFSFCAELPDFDYELMRLEGRWAAERAPELTQLGHGIARLQSLRGASSHQMNPFMALLRKDCTETAGECYGFQLIYSGSFAMTAEVGNSGLLRVQGGICDFGFCWELKENEEFVTPQVALCYSKEGLGRLSREYADFLREKVISPAYVYKRRPIVVNNWEATYFDFDNEKLFPIIDAAAELGIDTFVLDDGWFGNRNSDRTGLGDWFVNEKKLSGGLKTVIDRCKEKGLRFGLWFEPEMISEDSELYRAHPDWAIHKDGVEPCRGRNQLVLDFSREEIVDYVFDTVGGVLSSNDISYVKWDMNRNITECYSAALPADRQGEFMHRYILGVYSLAERLTSAFPNVFFEGCAGGGGRFDAGMLYYFPQIWTSDDTDGYERARIQWGTSICYPVSAMSCHVSACPNHQTQRITPFATRGAIASLGATGYELDLSKISEEEKRETAKQIEEYKRIDELVLKGDLYRLCNPFTHSYFCEMLVSKDKTQAYVVGERSLRVPHDIGGARLRLTGLDEEKTYLIEETGLVLSGKALANVGLIFPRLLDFGSWAWHIREVTEGKA